MEESQKSRKSVAAADFSFSNILALICAAILLLSFFFMPWYGIEMRTNGARIMADGLYGTPGAAKVPFIWLIPLIAISAILLALWGSLAPERERLASLFACALGIANLIYFFPAITQSLIPTAELRPGLGYWVALACTLGMIFQPLLALPAFHPTTAGGRKIGRSRFSAPEWATPYLFLAPPLLLYLLLIIGPTIYTMFLSLTNWDGVAAPGFIGLANFQRLFTKDRTFLEALGNNLRWLIVFITIPTTLGLAMAMIFNTEMRGGRFYKVSFYAPLVLSLPVIGLIWAWVYNPRLGLINNLLSGLGMQDTPGWLGDRAIAIWCVIAAAVWRQVGYVMVLYLAGLKNIDPSFIDAARVDGADRWNLFRHVIFPLLAPITTIIVVISIIDSLRAFDLVSIMTRGGQSTQVLANFMYMEAFNNYRMGYGAAIAVILFAISLVFIGLYLTQAVKDELEY